ncbi:M28 family metallopeptidase [Sphingomonas sp. IC-56]|uniref:M28 family metallopeptidase n=1 Tax=Sphingomonas sp. IC-56 TaxID=2898529 RepID=UPI001E3E657F|nr:M28 family metallopeptidase [Sphingomonas sp. IC-56]MCD2325158.1 M28 family metallopeptidase [Sphingomonas sp. IC-56]
MRRLSVPLFLAMLPAAAFAQDATPAQTPAQKNAIINAELPADQAALKSHVMFLASDALKGREAGSPEYDIAAQYVAAQFYAAGLKPMGDEGSYLQKVPLVSYKAADQGSMLVTGKRGPVTLTFGEDYLPGANPESPTFNLTAPVVFVGYGIEGLGRNDYKGINAKGKIVAFFPGAPSSFPEEEGAHFSSAASKAEIAARHGAVGYIQLESTRTGRGSYPVAMMRASWDRPRVTWGNPNGTGHIAVPGVPSLGILSKAGAAKLFAGARTPWTTIAKQAEKDGAVFKAIDLPGKLTVTSKTALTPMTSYNVAGYLPGSDPKLAGEVVVLSGHLDHVGVGKANAQGDTIYNGALDDAVGIASLIEEAKRFKNAETKPRRSILFLAVTAEEKGLIGSDYYANHPTVPGTIVANVNLDMPIITYKFQDVVVYGAQHSTLGPIVEKAGAAIGVTLSEDPLPGESIFTRSDHYNFVKKGVPSVFLWPGAGGPGRAAIDDFMKNHYHQASDQIGIVPINWESGVRFVDVNYRIAREIADGDQRPMWNKGDFFGTFYNGPGAK